MNFRDLKVSNKMADKHRKTMNILNIITFILFIPFVILQYLSIFLDWLCGEFSWIRDKIVYTIFKIIYKKEIIEETESERN